MSNHRKRPANKLEIEDEPEVKNTLDKRINDQPPTKLQKVVQNDQTSMKGSEDSKDQKIETQLPEDKKHASEAHFVEKKKIDQKSMTSSPNEDETPNAGMILHKYSNIFLSIVFSKHKLKHHKNMNPYPTNCLFYYETVNGENLIHEQIRKIRSWIQP